MHAHAQSCMSMALERRRGSRHPAGRPPCLPLASSRQRAPVDLEAFYFFLLLLLLLLFHAQLHPNARFLKLTSQHCRRRQHTCIAAVRARLPYIRQFLRGKSNQKAPLAAHRQHIAVHVDLDVFFLQARQVRLRICESRQKHVSTAHGSMLC